MMTFCAAALSLDERELCARLGCIPGEEMRLEIQACFRALSAVAECRCTYREVEVRRQEDGCDLGFGWIASRGLARALKGCSRAFLFAATLGHGTDRLLQHLAAEAPARHYICDAVASTLIESLCDAAQSSLPAPTVTRFSAGYGDFPLSFQREILFALNAEEELHIVLTKSLFMFPAKSVTAVIGIPDAEKKG